MSSQKRPKDEPPATTPAADDIVLIDGPTFGTRALPMSYFPATFALKEDAKTYLAGTGIALTEGEDSITISATGSGGTSTVVGYSSTDFANAGTGAITYEQTGWGWNGVGTATVYDNLRSYDDFTGVGTGTITSVTTGTGWAGDGTATVYT